MAGRKDGLRKVAGRGKFHEKVLRLAFVRAFVAGPVGVRGNAARAAMHAGMATTEDSAKVVGNRLMREPDLIAAIERKLIRADATNDRIIEELARIAFSDIREVVEWSDEKGVQFTDSALLDDETAAAIAEVSQRSGKQGLERKVKMHGKVEALALLARIQSMIKPARLEVTGEGGGPVKINFYLPENGRSAPEGDVIDVQALVSEPAALAPSPDA